MKTCKLDFVCQTVTGTAVLNANVDEGINLTDSGPESSWFVANTLYA